MASNYQRLVRAMNILDGPGTIQERLASAYRSEIQYIGPEGLDEFLVTELEIVNDELTKIEADGDKDSIEMSTELLSDGDALQLISKIRDIYQFLGSQH